MNRSNVAQAGPRGSSVMGDHIYGLKTAIGFPGGGVPYYQLRQRTNVGSRSVRYGHPAVISSGRKVVAFAAVLPIAARPMALLFVPAAR